MAGECSSVCGRSGSCGDAVMSTLQAFCPLSTGDYRGHPLTLMTVIVITGDCHPELV